METYDYDFDILTEFPWNEATKIRRFFDPLGWGEERGTVIRFYRDPYDRVDESKSWLGEFCLGGTSYHRIWRGLAPRLVTIFAGGAGHIVDVDCPESSIGIEVQACGAIEIPEKQMIVVYGLSEVVAYGAKGQLWRTGYMICYGLKLEEYRSNEGFLRASVDDMFDPILKSNQFAFDLETGAFVYP